MRERLFKFFNFYKSHSKFIVFAAFLSIALNEILLQIFKKDYIPYWLIPLLISLLLLLPIKRTFKVNEEKIKIKTSKAPIYLKILLSI